MSSITIAPLLIHSRSLIQAPIINNIRMIKRITLSCIMIFFLLSSAVHAQSSSPPVASPSATPHNREPSFDPVVVALVFALLFVSCFSTYICHGCNKDLTAGGLTVTGTNFCSSGPQGVDLKLLDTFPILRYSAVKHLKFGKAPPECAVCLSKFNQQDTLRLLPICNHVFHPECIDAWLASHLTCPVCRSRLMPLEEHRCGGNEVVILIPNEINAHRAFDESSESGTELNSVKGKSLGRCHSTGHSFGFGEIEGKNRERYTDRMSGGDVRKQITVNHGGMRRSASFEVFDSASSLY
ncbi:E3 ubiquitin-protein ligase ATL31-like [Prosopis cineraria]|uniref:E3 ubiquitin-protein ligase ATL31-like n=1 Tax=Prosopis cineraria TaxID=364024 RepID=UPI00240EA86D|nr:E3 ubiquitin-protein ligase ATL31-like [Prosopis cineraria]